MRISVRKLLGLTVLLAIAQTISAEYDVDSYCILVQNGIKLASIADCQTYYVCQNGEGSKQSCPKGQSFDKNLQSCQISSNVDCSIGNEKPCADKDDVFIRQPDKCRGWIYCLKGEVAGKGECGDGQTFSQGKCIWGNCADNPSEKEELQSICDIMPDKKYFGSTVSCEAWQRCVSGELRKGNCKEPGMVFNLENLLCDYQKPGMCDRVTGEGEAPVRSCPEANEGKSEADKLACNIYYKCEKKELVRFKCAAGEYYDIVANSCKARQVAVPSKDCDRCQGTKTNVFVNAVDENCQGWLSCKDGKKTGSGDCKAKEYFNEYYQACVPDSADKTIYAKNNGACYKKESGENPPVESGESGENPPVESGESGENPPVESGESGENPPVESGESGENPPVESGENPPVESGENPPVESGENPPEESGENPPEESGE